MSDAMHLTPARPISLQADFKHIEHRDAEVSNRIGAPSEVWMQLDGLVNVISSYEIAEYQEVPQPHNHVSVSVRADRRPNDEEMHMVRHVFDMEDAEEDNHSPGRIRNLFLPLNLPRGTQGICDCKSDETVVTESDGFQWSKEFS